MALKIPEASRLAFLPLAAALALAAVACLAPPSGVEAQTDTCLKCVYLTSPRGPPARSDTWGMPYNMSTIHQDWSCRFSGLVEVSGGMRYASRCRTDLGVNGWSCGLSCPGEMRCWGRGCFGTVYTKAWGYDHHALKLMRCVQSPFTCGKNLAMYAAWINATSGYDGPWMPPNSPCPEPPYSAFTKWPTLKRPIGGFPFY